MGRSDRTGRDDLGELDAEAGLPRGVLGREVAIGLDLVPQRVLLDGLAVDGGLGGLFGSLAEGFVIAGRGLGHTSTPLPRLHFCRAWMIEDAEMGYR